MPHAPSPPTRSTSLPPARRSESPRRAWGALALVALMLVPAGSVLPVAAAQGVPMNGRLPIMFLHGMLSPLSLGDDDPDAAYGTYTFNADWDDGFDGANGIPSVTDYFRAGETGSIPEQLRAMGW